MRFVEYMKTVSQNNQCDMSHAWLQCATTSDDCCICVCVCVCVLRLRLIPKYGYGTNVHTNSNGSALATLSCVHSLYAVVGTSKSYTELAVIYHCN